MRHLALLSFFALALSQTALATWQKINDVDYNWGPFKIYNIALFSETGEYIERTRPLMLTLTYAKPVEGRDFAISLARSWSNLGITLENQDSVVDRLRKIMPNIKKGDKLSYIALDDKGYFVLNDQVVEEEFNQAFSDAVVAVWLDERVEIGRRLVKKQANPYIANVSSVASSTEAEAETKAEETEPKDEAVPTAPPMEKNAPNPTAPPTKNGQDEPETDSLPADPLPENLQPIS